MRVLITGSRHWSDITTIYDVLYEIHMSVPFEAPAPILLSGCCPTGADAIGEFVAEHALHWEVERYYPDWKRFGNSAGPKRNAAMVETKPDLCVAFPLPGSRGTVDCMKKAKAAGIEVRPYNPRPSK